MKRILNTRSRNNQHNPNKIGKEKFLDTIIMPIYERNRWIRRQTHKRKKRRKTKKVQI